VLSLILIRTKDFVQHNPGAAAVAH
jgi:hypothetical protein